NAFERGWAERGLAVEGVEDDAFEQVAKGHVVIFSQGFEGFEDPFFHTDAGLDALDEKLGIIGHVYQCTMVPRSMQAVRTPRWYRMHNRKIVWERPCPSKPAILLSPGFLIFSA